MARDLLGGMTLAVALPPCTRGWKAEDFSQYEVQKEMNCLWAAAEADLV